MPGAGGDEKDGWEAPEVTDSESDPVDLVRERITVCTIKLFINFVKRDRFEARTPPVHLQSTHHFTSSILILHNAPSAPILAPESPANKVIFIF